MGTNKGSEGWVNPVQRGYIRVLSSSLAADSAPLTAVVGRDLVRCVTEPKRNSWMMIDFQNIKITPSHYTLKHYSSFETECLRNWRLEGSNDSRTGRDGSWTTIFTHTNDMGIIGKGATHTWHLECNDSYSKFRYLHTQTHICCLCVCVCIFCFLCFVLLVVWEL